MRRVLVLVSVLIVTLVPLIASGASQQATGPDATITALQTEVASLRTQVASLTTPAAVASAPDASPATQGDTASAYLAGDALPLLPNGRASVVDVIAVGAPVRSTVPVVVRNNTGTDVVLSGVLGIARDAAGALIASGDVSMFSPSLIPAGQVSIGSVFFGTTDVPPDAALEFEPDAKPVAEANAFRQDIEIAESTRQPNRIVGLARNGTDKALTGPFSVVGICFDQSGAIQGYYATYAAKNDLEPGETTPFDATFYGTGPCDAYLLGSTGYKGL